MGKGGGGNSGKVEYPSYMQTQHDSWLGDIDALIQTYLTGDSPYDSETAYDPDTPLAANQTRLDSFEAIVSALDSETDWDSIVTAANTKRSSVFALPNSDISTIEALAQSKADNEFGDAAADGITRTGLLITAGDTAITSLIDSLVDDAITKAASSDVSDIVDDLVDAYEEELKPAYFRGLNRFTGGMVDINATNGSAFVVGMALAENQFQSDIRKFRAEQRYRIMDRLVAEYGETYRAMMNLYVNTGVQKTIAQIQAYAKLLDSYVGSYMQYQKSRDIFLVESANQMASMLATNISADKDATALQTEINRIKIVSKKEQVDRDLEIDVKDAAWPFDVLLMGGNLLASISGAAHTVNYPMSTVQSALSGVITGASAGATISGGNPYITGAGALAGLVMALS
jgi:hypothetical protein